MQKQYPPLIERGDTAASDAGFVIVCEHASAFIPDEFSDLGLKGDALRSHIAWDPGALGVAKELRRIVGGDLVAGSVSRLLYDCNRPPDAPSAMPARSEVYDIPGNLNVSSSERKARATAIYEPFFSGLSAIMDLHPTGILVTIHSFTPIYNGERRHCEIGILHDEDTLLADAMLATVGGDYPFKVERNVPYSAKDGVTHTLKEHALKRGWLNVMIEIRNDLIASPAQQKVVAAALAGLLSSAVSRVQA